MVRFNIDMRAVRVERGELDAFEHGVLRKILEVPAQRFRGERDEKRIVIVMGTVQCAPGEIERLMPELKTMMAATRAEDGCLLYAFSRDVLDPDLLHISERWRDDSALAAHFASPHVVDFNTALATARIEELSVKAYDSDGERVLMRR